MSNQTKPATHYTVAEACAWVSAHFDTNMPDYPSDALWKYVAAVRGTANVMRPGFKLVNGVVVENPIDPDELRGALCTYNINAIKRRAAKLTGAEKVWAQVGQVLSVFLGVRAHYNVEVIER